MVWEAPSLDLSMCPRDPRTHGIHPRACCEFDRPRARIDSDFEGPLSRADTAPRGTHPVAGCACGRQSRIARQEPDWGMTDCDRVHSGRILLLRGAGSVLLHGATVTAPHERNGQRAPETGVLGRPAGGFSPDSGRKIPLRSPGDETPSYSCDTASDDAEMVDAAASTSTDADAGTRHVTPPP